jgi:hypothetical protein
MGRLDAMLRRSLLDAPDQGPEGGAGGLALKLQPELLRILEEAARGEDPAQRVVQFGQLIGPQ